jgi:eukaryotic-like serine/threonine-protein kinase
LPRYPHDAPFPTASNKAGPLQLSNLTLIPNTVTKAGPLQWAGFRGGSGVNAWLPDRNEIAAGPGYPSWRLEITMRLRREAMTNAMRTWLFGVALLAAVAAGAVVGWKVLGPGMGMSPPPAVSAGVPLAWRFRTAGPVSAEPAVVGSRVYVGSGDGNVYALDLASGKMIWSYHTKGAVDGAVLPAGDRIYAGSCDSFLYCLSAADGSPIWRHETGDRIVGSPAMIRGESDSPRVVVGSYDKNLHCVDADGNLSWKYETGNYVNGSPVVARAPLGGGRFADWIVFGGCDQMLHVVDFAGRRVHAINLGSYVIATAAVEGGEAYIGQRQGEMIRVDLAAGGIRWRRSMSPEAVYSSAALDASRLVYGSWDGNVYCLDRAKGNRLWNAPTGGQVDASAAICDGLAVIGSDDGVMRALRMSDGKEAWSYRAGEPIKGKAALADGLVIFGCNDGCVYAIKPPAMKPPSSKPSAPPN